jgi:23S rRNA (adenine2503-C2)-methyltransferase
MMTAMTNRDLLELSRREIAASSGSAAKANRVFRDTYLDHAFELPLAARRFDAVDGTRRYLVGLADGHSVESVLIPESDRSTFCVSSQVGCALACTFCLTGQLGLSRNLSAGEIVAQVLLLRREAPDARFSVVFMGMGEPLQNYDSVMKSIEIMTDDYGMAVPLRRITVSTAGIVPALERLALERLFPNISISLTGTSDEVRDRLMPINRRYPIAAVMDTVRQMRPNRRKRVMFEYVLLRGITDSPGDAGQLASLVQGTGAKVNLIPLNTAPELPYARPEAETVLEFQRVLLDKGITTFIRKNRGNEVSAACGQLKQTEGRGV